MNNMPMLGFKDKGFENRFHIFFEQRFSFSPKLTNYFAENCQSFLENEQFIFFEQSSFKGLEKLNVTFTTHNRTAENLKIILSSIVATFENYKTTLTSNSQKVKSYFEYLEHIQFISDGFGTAYLQLLQNLDFFKAFENELLKKFKIVKNVFDYLASNKLSLAVESTDFQQTDVAFENTRKMSLFEISVSKSRIIRQGLPTNRRITFQNTRRNQL